MSEDRSTAPAEPPSRRPDPGRRFEKMIQTLDGVFWEADGETFEFRFVSPQVERIFRHTVDEFLTPGFWATHIHPDDRERALTYCAESTRARRDHRFSYRFRRGDGEFIWVEDFVVVDPADGPPLLRGVMMDCTERKALEARVHQSDRLEALGRLAGGLAHDFNNLLSVVLGCTEEIRGLVDPGGRAANLVDDIQRATARGSDLTGQLLGLARPDASPSAQVFFDHEIGQSVGLLRHLLRDDVEIVTDLAAGSALVRVVPGQLQQVVLNLLLNAQDAMPDGGRVSVTTRVADEGVTLDVTDEGVGMDAATVARVFDPFFTTKGPSAGTGLGLSTVHGMVRGAGGTIEVVSSPGAGATFRVAFPVDGSGQRPPSGEHPRAEEASSEPGLRVLVVEDDSAVRRVVMRLVRAIGHQAVEARDGLEALARVDDSEVDVILTDVDMPRLGGSGLAARLRDRGASIPIVFMTGYGATATRLLEREGARVLHKPLRKATVADALAAATSRPE